MANCYNVIILMHSGFGGNDKAMVMAAGIDIGTNSFRLLIADITRTNCITKCKQLNTVRLGEGLGDDQFLDSRAMDRGIDALKQFAGMIARYQPCYIRACGTHALRCASGNRDLFLERARSVLGFEIDIVGGLDEAELTLRGARFVANGAFVPPLLLVDVGGGSTELIMLDKDGAQSVIISLPIGAVNLTEKFGCHGLGSADLTAMAVHVNDLLKEALAQFAPQVAGCQVVGSGGTATSLAALDLELAVYDEKLVQNHVLAMGRLDNIFTTLAALTDDQRQSLPGLGEGRGRIIIAGAVIYRQLLQLLAGPEILVSDGGLLEGILLSSLPDDAGL